MVGETILSLIWNSWNKRVSKGFARAPIICGDQEACWIWSFFHKQNKFQDLCVWFYNGVYDYETAWSRLSCHIAKLVQDSWCWVLIREILATTIQNFEEQNLYTLVRCSIVSPENISLSSEKSGWDQSKHKTTKLWCWSSGITIICPIWITTGLRKISKEG